MALNTDLAAEAFNDARKAGELDGAEVRERFDERSRMKIIEVEITTDSAAERLGRPCGLYITLETDQPLWEYSPLFEERAETAARELAAVCGGEIGSLLFAGLGNRQMTADSVGVLSAEKVLATRHMKRLAAELDTSELTETSVIIPGVLAQTGMESAELVRAACREVKPSQVIVCDALACFDPRHMGRSIQFGSSGIIPGSGVDNSRAELSERTLGVRIAAAGVPTVSRLMSEKGALITPKPIDRLSAAAAELIAAAVNRLICPNLSHEEILSLL